MTEAEWLACDNPIAMLRALRHGASARKLRLFGCACCRRIWGELPSDLNRRLVAAVEDHPEELGREQYPDGPFSHPVLGDAITASSSVESRHAESEAYWAVKYLGRTYYKLTPYQGAPVTALRAAASAKAARPGRPEKAAQADILRCIFGPSHRPVAADPCWITPLVTSLATAAYEDRALPSGELDAPLLAVLADALEDAGCTDADLLGHLRGPGPHVRGCWALDLILGKG
jgi:hypothetical protein